MGLCNFLEIRKVGNYRARSKPVRSDLSHLHGARPSSPEPDTRRQRSRERPLLRVPEGMYWCAVPKSHLRTPSPRSQQSLVFLRTPWSLPQPFSLAYGLEHSATVKQTPKVSPKRRMSFTSLFPEKCEHPGVSSLPQRQGGGYLARGSVRAVWLPKRVDTHHRPSSSL